MRSPLPFALCLVRLAMDLSFCHPMDADSKSKPLHENLDTTFVNLWSLLRSLTQKQFVGRVHVESADYSADIFMNGSATPVVHEVDHATGTETTEESALHRLVLRTRETPAKITIFEGAEEAAFLEPASKAAPVIDASSANEARVRESVRSFPNEDPTEIPNRAEPKPVRQSKESSSADVYPAGSYSDWPAILSAAGELIGAIERGINASGSNFDSLFRAARVELADDYSFLDPFSQTFVYQNGVATLNQEMTAKIFSSGLSQALRLVVNRGATDERERRIRERIAVEMSGVARKYREVLERSGFQEQLDRIAGTRVM